MQNEWLVDYEIARFLCHCLKNFECGTPLSGATVFGEGCNAILCQSVKVNRYYRTIKTESMNDDIRNFHECGN